MEAVFILSFLGYLLLCSFVGSFAKATGRNYEAGFLLAFLTTPIVGATMTHLISPKYKGSYQLSKATAEKLQHHFKEVERQVLVSSR